MKRKKLLIFSDCFTYSGSENVIENILLSKKIAEKFDVYFLYGYNKSYDLRFKERAKLLGINIQCARSVPLLSPDWSVYRYNLTERHRLKKMQYFVQVVFLKVLKFFFISHIINFFALNWAIKKLAPDLIFINNGGYPASFQCCLAVFVARFLKIHEIFFNINNMAMPRRKFYERYLDNYMSKAITRFITASFAAQKHASELRGFKQDMFVRIPNTIFNDEKICEIYGKADQDPHLLIFGSVGLLTERKGYHILLKAAGILAHTYKIVDFKINLIGDGEDRQRLIDEAEEYQVSTYVNFLGFRPEPLIELNKLDVFILPSLRNEDFPYVILEAMILRKPVIGTEVAGIPEQIIDTGTGFLVNPNDAEALAKSMRYFIENRHQIDAMGDSGREKYMNEFRYSIIEQIYLKLFTNL